MFDQLNDVIKNTGANEFEILKWRPDGTIILYASFDLDYYHTLEININGVEYISLPKRFEYASFRLASEEEKKGLLKTNLFYTGLEYLLIAIDLDKDFGDRCETHFVDAKSIEFNEVMVYHYKRDNLKDGESLEEWVQ